MSGLNTTNDEAPKSDIITPSQISKIVAKWYEDPEAPLEDGAQKVIKEYQRKIGITLVN